MIPEERLCLFCVWFYFTAGSAGYSEYTPGSEMDIGCEKEVWEIHMDEDGECSLRIKMLSAEKCKHYKLSPDVLDIKDGKYTEGENK